MVGYNFISPVAAPRIKRAQGHKIVADLIEHAKLNKGDYIILQYYPKSRFEKYVNFSDYNVISIDKGNFPEYLSANIDYKKVLKNGKEIYRETFKADSNYYFTEKLIDEVISKIKPGQNVLVIMMNGAAFYSPSNMVQIVNTPALYEKTPLLFLVFSYVKTQTFIVLSQTLAVRRFESRGDWSAIMFTKLNK